MTNIPSWLIIALQEMGQQEIVGRESNPRINEYLSVCGLPGDDEIPWCAAFINWVLKQSGKNYTGEALARSFVSSGIKLSVPILGCVTVLKRGKYKWQGHVGLYMDHYGGKIQILGGNQHNRVGINSYRIADVLAYRWPVEETK